MAIVLVSSVNINISKQPTTIRPLQDVENSSSEKPNIMIQDFGLQTAVVGCCFCWPGLGPNPSIFDTNDDEGFRSLVRKFS